MISVCCQDEEEEIKLEINVLKKVRHMLASWAIEHLVVTCRTIFSLV